MKNTDFLKSNYFYTKGLYDNKVVFEDTFDSFKKAIDKGYGLFFTIGLTKDNVLIVYEDKDLTRLVSLKDKTIDTNYDELEYLCSYHILTLKEALDLIKGVVPILINIKDVLTAKEFVKVMEGYNNNFAVVSAYSSVIKWFNKNRDDIVIGEVITKRKRRSIIDLFNNCTIVTDFKSYNLDYFNSYKLTEYKEESLVLGYVIRSKEEFIEFKDKFDNLIIDNTEI